jgi:hypothetical protein
MFRIVCAEVMRGDLADPHIASTQLGPLLFDWGRGRVLVHIRNADCEDLWIHTDLVDIDLSLYLETTRAFLYRLWDGLRDLLAHSRRWTGWLQDQWSRVESAYLQSMHKLQAHAQELQRCHRRLQERVGRDLVLAIGDWIAPAPITYSPMEPPWWQLPYGWVQTHLVCAICAYVDFRVARLTTFQVRECQRPPTDLFDRLTCVGCGTHDPPCWIVHLPYGDQHVPIPLCRHCMQAMEYTCDLRDAHWMASVPRFPLPPEYCGHFWEYVSARDMWRRSETNAE